MSQPAVEIDSSPAPTSELDNGAVPLVEAIEALRSTLEAAMEAGAGERLRFQAAPIELTLQVAVTSSATAEAGIKWWLVSAGAGGSHERTTTQTIKLSLDPVWVDSGGKTHKALIDAADD